MKTKLPRRVMNGDGIELRVIPVPKTTRVLLVEFHERAFAVPALEMHGSPVTVMTAKTLAEALATGGWYQSKTSTIQWQRSRRGGRKR